MQSLKLDIPPFDKVASWAEEAMKERCWDVAVERWSILREVYPEKPPVWIQAGAAALKAGDYPRANDLLHQAVERFPENCNAVVQMARLLIALERYDEADDLLTSSRLRFSGEISIWLVSAELAHKKGDESLAEEFNCHAENAFSMRPGGLFQRAIFAMENGRWENALAIWSVFREKFPEQSAGYMQAALCAEKLGDQKQARKLRLAREYGNAWLNGDANAETKKEESHAVMPPQSRTLKTFFDLLMVKTQLNLKSEASKNQLRYLWWLIDPLLYMLVFYAVFGLLLNRGGEGYVGYLMAGLIPFQWFAKTVGNSAGSILAGRGLMNQVKVSAIFFPMVAVLQNTVKQLPVFLFLIIFIILYGLPPSIHWLGLIPIMLTHFLFIMMVACLVAMVVPFFRDLLQIVPTFIQFMLFVSGVFFLVDSVPEAWQSLFFINPMAGMLYEYRLVLLENQWPDWWLLLKIFSSSCLGMLLVIFIFKKVDPVYPRVVLE